MADLQFFFDPVCPWAYITSRWVTEVQQQRNYDVSWKFISLFMINDERGYGEGKQAWRDGHFAGLQALRVASA
ncbi:MAG: DsbA family protein, partial [Actinomycetota bacterium]